MRKRSLLTAALIGVFLMIISPPLRSQQLTAREIIQKANDKANGQSSQGEMKMTIVRSDWSREVTMKVWSKGIDFYMILITGPANDKGQVFLKRYNDMWNWIPDINRMIKIPPSMMGQSWMGSDFTNDDLVKMNSIVDDYNHTMIGEETIDNYDCYKIELLPKPEAAVVWGKIIFWIEKEEYYELKGEYFDEDGILVNTMNAWDIKYMGDRYLPARMNMIPEDKPGQETRMEMINMKFNVPMEESFFSQQNMKQVR